MISNDLDAVAGKATFDLSLRDTTLGNARTS